VVKHNLRRALFSCTLLASLTATGALGVQLPKAAAYLTFDEDNGTAAADSSGNNNATLIGAAGWTTGLVGPFALGLPGDPGSYAQIPGDVIDTTKSYTVTAWVKLNTSAKSTRPSSAKTAMVKAPFSCNCAASFWAKADAGFQRPPQWQSH
jgi:hypothetical protein